MASSGLGLAVLLGWFAALAAVGAIAQNKGRNRFRWGMAAFVFGPVVVLVVLVMRPSLAGRSAGTPA